MHFFGRRRLTSRRSYSNRRIFTLALTIPILLVLFPITYYGLEKAGLIQAAPPVASAIWRMDEAAGTTLNDGTTNANTGTVTNATWRIKPLCQNENCLFFDGTGDFVSRADDADFDFLAADTFSFSIWFRHAPKTSGTEVLIAKHNATAGGYKMVMESDGDITCGIDDDLTYGPEDFVTSTAATYDDDRWHHALCVKNGTSSLTLYLDGQSVGTPDTSFTSTGTLANANTFYLGIDGNGSSNAYIGYLDEFRMFRVALSAGEAKTEYNNSVATRIAPQDSDSLVDGLVGYWPLNESATPAVDFAGNSNSGTWTGNAAQVIGKFVSGTTLDGTGDYISVADSASLSTTGAVTIAAWVYPSSSIATKAIVVKDGSYRLVTDGSGNPLCQINNGSWQTAATSSTALSLSTWQHVVCTYDGTTAKIIVNGSLTGTSAVSTTIADSANALRIGSDSGATYGDFNGRQDEVRVYIRALSQRDILQLYSWAPGATAYWKMSDNSGQSLVDSSGNSNTGTLGSSASVESVDPTWVKGKFDAALGFDGATSNKYVRVSDSSTINITATEGLTVSAWVRRTGNSQFNNPMYVFDKINANTNPGYSLTLEATSSCSDSTNDGDLVCFKMTDTGTDTYYMYTTATLTADSLWHYVTATVDRSSETNSKIYIDGVEQAVTRNGTFANIGDLTSSTVLGCIGISSGGLTCGSTQQFNGNIDELVIYKYPRSQAQIVEDMNGSHPLGGSPIGSQLVFWTMDEQQGTTLNNKGYGGTTYNGTTSGSVWSAASLANCKLNGCQNFDTSTDYASIADANLASLDSLTGFSTSFWINPQTMGTDKSIISKNDASQRSFAIVTDASDNSKLRVHIAASAAEAANTTYCTTDTGALTVSTWQHFVIVYDGTQGTASDRVKIYKDGRQITCGNMQGTLPTAMTATSTSDLRVGDDVSATYSALLAYIDEVKIYNAALSSAQALIEANYGSAVAYSTGNNEVTQITGTAETLPVGNWPLDEGTGTTTRNQGSSQDGTLTSGPTWGIGKVGQAIKFDGTDDYVTFGDLSSLDFTDGTSFTAEAWIYRTSVANDGVILSKKNCASAGCAGFEIFQWSSAHGGNTCLYVADGTDQIETCTADNSTETLNTWYHIVAVYDDTSLTNTTIYINGVNVKHAPYDLGTIGNVNSLANTNSYLVGAEASGTPANFFAGSIDDVKVYGYKRTRAQISQDYNRGAPTGWWKLDDCTGTTAYDSSGNGNNATLTYGGGTYTQAGTCTSGTASDAWYGGATGKFNASLAMDTTTDTINIGNIAAYSFERTDPFSTSVWIKTSTAASMTLISKQDSSAPYSGWNVQTSASGFIYFQLVNTYSSNTLEVLTASDTGYSNGSWHHIVATYDGSSTPGGVHIYVDGVDKALSTAVNTLSATTVNSISVYLGSRNGTAQKYDGQLDDARIYNYALTSSQVQKLYNQASGVRFGPQTGSP